MRRLKARWLDRCTGVHQVIDIDSLADHWLPNLQYLVPVSDDVAKSNVAILRHNGLMNVSWVECEGVALGDVVALGGKQDELSVLFREADVHHALFLTNRCNSYCLMCSQPPSSFDDSWLIEEAIDVIRHIRASPNAIGLTGGEPLLLRSNLRRVLDAAFQFHPRTVVETLTNARLFSEGALARDILEDLPRNVRWLVPLYGHADFLHDYVVQRRGAFDETISGMLELQAYGQPIQLRIVLIEPVLQHLEEICEFVGRNLPFVHEVALMACEPIGFALANREICEVNLTSWGATLIGASDRLRRYGLRYLFMNTPLCSLEKSLWPMAHQSISDWKRVFAPECAGCQVRDRCSGLFAWHERGWKPSTVVPILEEAT